MIKLFLCDDNQALMEKCSEILTSIAKKHKIELTIQTFLSGEQLLFYLENTPSAADIIYLDIVMPGLDGISTAKILRENGCQSEIIFLTARKEFVFDSFDVSPVHYLLKESVGSPQFEEVFLRAVRLVQNKADQFFFCQSGAVKKKIPVQSISYFNAQIRMVVIHYDKKTFTFYSTMDKLEQKLDPSRFCRCHRSFIVNLSYIDEIDKNELLLITGERLPIGDTYAKSLKQALSTYLSNNY